MIRLHEDDTLGGHADELMHLFHDLIYQEPVLSMLPEDGRNLRELIDKMYPEGATRRTDTNTMLLRVGIALVRATEPMTISQLSNALRIPLSNTSRLIDWLEASGFAERSPDREDLRVVRLSLTDSGLRLFRSIYALLQRRMEWQLSSFTHEEREILLLLMRKFVAAGRRIHRGSPQADA